ncbi:MAG: hypothetical protein K1X67_17680 [Fimbriimonadaceae bacterium]|nr:hypothetical protein [Fimbriimonadaceae bacterium]
MMKVDSLAGGSVGWVSGSIRVGYTVVAVNRTPDLVILGFVLSVFSVRASIRGRMEA